MTSARNTEGRQSDSGHRLHQSATGIGVVVVVFGTALEEGVDAEGEQAEDAGNKAEAALEAATHIDQLAHEAM